MSSDCLSGLGFHRINSRILRGLLLGGIATAVTATELMAQGSPSMQRLPPPPPLRIPDAPIPGSGSLPAQQVPVPSVSVPASPPSRDDFREYTFQAPASPNLPAHTIPVNPATRSNAAPPESAIAPTQLFRVEIEGTDETLLAQVKAVEPLAAVWQGQGVIYGGLFAHSQQAQERVRQLEQKGVTAKIIPISRELSHQHRLDR